MGEWFKIKRNPTDTQRRTWRTFVTSKHQEIRIIGEGFLPCHGVSEAALFHGGNKIPDNYCCYLKKKTGLKRIWHAESVIFLSQKGFMKISTAETDVWKCRVCRLKKASVKTKMDPGAAKLAQWDVSGEMLRPLLLCYCYFATAPWQLKTIQDSYEKKDEIKVPLTIFWRMECAIFGLDVIKIGIDWLIMHWFEHTPS